MRIVLGLLLAIFGAPFIAVAQPQLSGSIGLSSMPADNDGVCTFPRYNISSPADLNQYGLSAGTVIPDFTLFTRDSIGVTASSLLATGKPLILICASYTCDIFRAAIPQINQIYTNYSDRASIYLIYTVEAHPTIDTNMYVPREWVPQRNYDENVLYRQPMTYGARKALVDTMLTRQMSPIIKPPILLDGPCNNWWRTFGPAPNCAYVIRPDGRVYYHQAWFNGEPGKTEFLYKHIDSLLGPKQAVGKTTKTLSARIWPNPVCANGTLHLDAEDHGAITLYDVLGRAVLSREVTDNVSLDGLSAGSYLYKFESGSETKTARLIITP